MHVHVARGRTTASPATDAPAARTAEEPVLTAYWAAKGGAGATVLAAAHALAASATRPALAVDLDGDLSTALGVDAAGRPGVADWLRAGPDVPADALDRLLVPVADDLALLPRGAGPLAAERAAVLGRLLATTPREVVVDAGTRPGPAARAVVREADRSTLVSRACYLALRRAQALDVGPTDVILVREPNRALGADDVARAVGAPVRAVVPLDPAIARAVDAGLLTARLPRKLQRAVPTAALRGAA